MQSGLVKTDYDFEDHTWLYSHDGAKGAKPVTLDLTLFPANTYYPKGILRSGIEIARVTSTKLFGPYDPAASDGRQLSIEYLFTTQRVRAGGGNRVLASALDGTYTPTIVVAKLPIATKLTDTTRGTIGRRFIFFQD